jgi:hypothetical protein
MEALATNERASFTRQVKRDLEYRQKRPTKVVYRQKSPTKAAMEARSLVASASIAAFVGLFCLYTRSLLPVY